MSGSKKKTGGISIHVIHIAMILCAVVIIVLLLLSTVQTSNVFSALSRETGNYLTRQKAAHDLMEASDYLTEMVQRFTLEGDTVYLDNYLMKRLFPSAGRRPSSPCRKTMRSRRWCSSCRKPWMSLRP